MAGSSYATASRRKILEYLKKAESELNDIKLSDERTNELKEELKNITKELKEKGNVLTLSLIHI